MSRRAAPLLALACLASCLVPQDVEPLTARPHEPPRIRVEAIPTYLLAPTLNLVYRGSGDPPGCGCALDLTIPVVEMDDPLPNLTARWFVDYGTDPRSQAQLAEVTLQGSFDPTQVTRGPVRFRFDANALGLAPGPHVVEVVIAEQGTFVDDSPTLPHRAVLPGYESAVYRFFVNYEQQDPNVVTCPGEPPAVRLCP